MSSYSSPQLEEEKSSNWSPKQKWCTTTYAPLTLTQNPEAVRAGNYRGCFVNQAHPWLLLVNGHTHPWNSWKRTLLVWLCFSAYCNYVAFNCALLTPLALDEQCDQGLRSCSWIQSWQRTLVGKKKKYKQSVWWHLWCDLKLLHNAFFYDRQGAGDQVLSSLARYQFKVKRAINEGVLISNYMPSFLWSQ